MAEAAAPSDSLFLGAVYKYTHSLTHSLVNSVSLKIVQKRIVGSECLQARRPSRRPAAFSQTAALEHRMTHFKPVEIKTIQVTTANAIKPVSRRLTNRLILEAFQHRLLLRYEGSDMPIGRVGLYRCTRELFWPDALPQCFF